MRAALAGALALGLLGCQGVSPVLRQGLERLEQGEAHRNEREAVLRKLLGSAWRELAETEAARGLETDAKDGLTTAEAAKRLKKALDQIDRAQGILRGFESEAAGSSRDAANLRSAIAGALRELEERSAATEALGDAMEQAAGQVGRIQAEREKRKAAEAEARRLEAEAAAREGEE